MWQNLLPYGLMCIIQSMKLNKNSLEWFLQCNGQNITLNLKWIAGETNQDKRGEVQQDIFKRRKTPSAIRRDRQRRQKFWENKERTKSEKIHDRSHNFTAQQDSTPAKVSTLLLCETENNEFGTRTVSAFTQTDYASTNPAVTQTEKYTGVSLSTQTDDSNCELYKFNIGIQTEHNFPSKSVEVQTDESTNDTTKITSGHVEKCHVRSNKSEVTTETNDDSFQRKLQAFKQQLGEQHEQSKLSGKNCVAMMKTVTRVTEKVLKMRIKNGEEQYLIKYKDLAPSSNQWVAQSDLDEGATEYLKIHTVPCVGSKHKVTFKSPQSERGLCTPPSETSVLTEVNPNIVRVHTMHCRYGKLSYTVQLNSGNTLEVKKEEIPPDIFERYMRVGY